MIRNKFACLVVVTLLPVAGHADVVTYDFTGTVTSSTDSPIPIGAAISGTYQFQYADPYAGDLIQTTGIVGSTTSPWSVSVPSAFGQLPLVFASTVSAGGTIQYSSVAINNVETNSGVSGGSGGLSATQWSSYDEIIIDHLTYISYSSSGLSLPTFDSQGLPLFSARTGGSGYFHTEVPSGFAGGPNPVPPPPIITDVRYNVTSLNLAPPSVPLPAAAWLLLSGLGGLVFAGRRLSAP